MGRYANSTVRLSFPDLSEDDDEIYVVIRNPKTIPIEKLKAKTEITLDKDGAPETESAMTAGFEVIAGLIVDWHVYDATLDDDSPAMGLPATPDMVRVLPMEIASAISSEIGKVTATPQ